MKGGFTVPSHNPHRIAILALGIITVIIFLAVFADAVAPHNPNRIDLPFALSPPSWSWSEHFLGTDMLGRDILSRIIYGARISLLVGIGAVFLASVIGISLGLISACEEGWIGEGIMRITDLVLSLPSILIALVAAATIGPSLINVIFIISFIYWAQFARMVRGEALSIKVKDFVMFATLSGSGLLRVMWRHLLPNLMNTVIVLGTLQLASAIILEATLSFLGVGVPPPTPTWGLILSEGRPYLNSSWWIVTFPGVAIMLTVLSINILGDWLRDILDPKQRQL